MYSIEIQTIINEYLNKDPKININFVSPGRRPFRANETGFNLNVSIIRCDK